MNNKLEEILEEFEESFMMEFSYKVHDRLRQFLQKKLVEYARSKVPNRIRYDYPDITDLSVPGFNRAIQYFKDSIDQDLQALNN